MDSVTIGRIRITSGSHTQFSPGQAGYFPMIRPQPSNDLVNGWYRICQSQQQKGSVAGKEGSHV